MGSAEIGENAYIAPGTMVKQQTKVGAESFAGIGTVILKDVEAGKTVIGVPARELKK